MATLLKFYETDDTTLATAITVALNAGDSTAEYTRHLWNDNGGGTGGIETARNVRLAVEAWDGAEWVRSGLPILDEKWTRIRISGEDKTGDATMESQTEGFLPIGTDSFLQLSDIPQNCARYVVFKIQAPGSASSVATKIRLAADKDEPSSALSAKVAASIGNSVLLGRLNEGRRRIRRGRGITADGTDTVTAEKGSFDYDGVTHNVLDTTQVLNQNDSAAAALVSGESYKVTVSQKSDKTVTWTKGVKGVSPATPATPAGEIFLGVVTVAYGAGGSVIVQNDVDQTGFVRGEYLVEAGTGLAVKIAAGDGLSSTDQYQTRAAESSLSLDPSVTSYVWKLPDGTFSKTTTTTQPEAGATLLASVVTDGSAVTSVTDRRQLVGRSVVAHVIELRPIVGAVTFTGADLDWSIVPPGDWDIEDVVLELGTLGDPTSGSHKIDITTRPAGTDLGTSGTTIYTSQGSDDQRPSIAFDAVSLRTVGVDHEVRRVTGGQRIAVDVDAVPSGATTDPTDLRVYIHLMRA